MNFSKKNCFREILQIQKSKPAKVSRHEMCLIMQKDRSQSFTQSENKKAPVQTFSKFFHPNPAKISYLCLASKKIQKNMFQKQLIQVGTIQTTIIHHSKHVYKQSNPSGTPPMPFEPHLSKRHFCHISCICLPKANNSIEMCSKWPKAMIDCDQGQIGVIYDTFALNQSGRGPF